MAPAYCPTCGSPIPVGAQFCPNCGQSVAAPADRPIVVAPPPPRAKPWWIMAIPIGILAIGLIFWAVLAGMPFGNRQEQVRTLSGVDTSNTIGESAQTTDTVAQIGGTVTTTTQPPLPVVQTAAPPPPPIIIQTQTQPPAPPPMASSSPPPMEISEDDAVSKLHDYLATNNPDTASCLDIRSAGYRNHGYTLDAHDTCQSPPTSLGRWRVDAVNGEIYRQNDSGRFVRP